MSLNATVSAPARRPRSRRSAEPPGPARRRRFRTVVATVVAAAAATACGGSSDAAAPTASSAPPVTTAAGSTVASTAPPAASATAVAPVTVTIKDFAFAVPAGVPAGTAVQVRNTDGEAHTVTADSGGAFDTMVGGTGTASFTAPAKPGRYPFHCAYHGNMHGVLVVT